VVDPWIPILIFLLPLARMVSCAGPAIVGLMVVPHGSNFPTDTNSAEARSKSRLGTWIMLLACHPMTTHLAPSSFNMNSRYGDSLWRSFLPPEEILVF
jgi:hypothetical protein